MERSSAGKQAGDCLAGEKNQVGRQFGVRFRIAQNVRERHAQHTDAAEPDDEQPKRQPDQCTADTLHKRMKIDIVIDENQSPADYEEHERRNREHGGSVGVFRLHADRIDHGGAKAQRRHDR